MNKKYSQSQPIILGLAGKAGSGKTSVAEAICPKGSIKNEASGIIWEHIFHALPLYDFASTKKNIKGFNSESRKLFSIHEILYDIYGNSALGNIPPYNDFVDKVHRIYNLPIEQEGQKPRTFLQKAGDICREGYEDCFSHWAIMKSIELYRKNIKTSDNEEVESSKPVCIIISDVRFINEAKAILKQPNGMLVTFEASAETLRERIYKRDGVYLTDEQLNHHSENQIEEIKNMSTFVVNTDNLSIEKQAKITLDIVNSHTLLGV